MRLLSESERIFRQHVQPNIIPEFVKFTPERPGQLLKRPREFLTSHSYHFL